MKTSAKIKICEQLAVLTAATSSARVPPEITEEARLCLFDFVASTTAASLNPMLREISCLFGPGKAKLLNENRSISIAGATFVHGFLSTVEDIDDAHALSSGMHLSATVFPTALALAQAKGSTEAQFLRAVLAGYEIAGRLSRSMDSGLRARGFHASGVIGPFASCAAASILLNLSPKQTANAFGIAASGAGGIFAFLKTGADSRHMHAATAGLNGLTAAIAARNGATGPLNAFEGPDGLIGPYSKTYDSRLIFAPFPGSIQQFEILNAYHKKFSACGHAIPGITLALALRNGLKPSCEIISSIEIFGYSASAKLTNYPVETISQAKFSLPIVFALAYLFGRVSPAEMQTGVISSPKVRLLAEKITVHESPEHNAAFPTHRKGSIRVTLVDGTVQMLATQTPIGMSGNRLTVDDVQEKFASFSAPKLGKARAKALTSSILLFGDTDKTVSLIR